ncbi:MAG: response regulator [Alphaproteobacteria bacterium]|nr:response regulator [Alphaproteobacteria bacterium]
MAESKRRSAAGRATPTYFTTYQVSKILGVSLPTVVNWVNSERLNAHRTPGGHRRISRSDLITFAREYNYPLSDEFLSESGGKRRVLIVDDEQDFADMVKDYLSMKGSFDVEVADSGFAAGYTVARFQPDLILMDIMMPDMDGFEVLRMLRAGRETHHVPVIACTAYRDARIERRILEDDFDGFVQKPLKLDELIRLIRKCLGAEGARAH